VHDPRVRAVEVVADSARVRAGVVVVLDAAGLRVEGLDVPAVADLLVRLR
jgi:hypothetical protein